MSSGDLAAALEGLVAALVMAGSEQQIVDRGMTGLVDLLPVQGAGVTLFGAGDASGVVGASDSTAFALERLQERLGEGPCVVARHGGEICLSPDVGRDHRFLRYGPAAVRAGVGGVFAFPLRFGADALGIVDLYTSAAGELSDESVAAARVMSGVLSGLLVNARDRARLESDATRLREAVGHDPLTGLANRRLLIDRIEQALGRRSRSGRTVAVAVLDIDDFKAVNDRYGHRVGDLLLIAVARRLTAVLRPSDTLARLSGDEFVVVFEDLSAADELDPLLSRISDRLNAPFEVSDAVLEVTASVGCTVSSRPDDSPEGLIDAADRTMYAQKRDRGRGPSATPPWTPSSESTVKSSVVGRTEAPPVSSGRWAEWWIEGPTPHGGVFAHVIRDGDRNEMLITELDQRALIIQRHEWQPIPTATHGHGDEFELTTTDWDGEPIATRRCRELPPAPQDTTQLTRLLTEIDPRG